MHKLQVQLKSLHDQLQVNSTETAVPQDRVDASYKLCFDVARKIEHEQSALRDEIETLTKDKSQLAKEKHQYSEEIKCLKRELKEKGITLLLIACIILLHDCTMSCILIT